MLTRVFKSGHSLAVRIPKELAFADVGQEVEIERVGNALVLRPLVQETIGDLTEIFAAFPKSFMAEGREFHEQRERDWDCAGLNRTPTAPDEALNKGSA
ncbi:MAG: hypothetical protein OHK0048_27050 [Rhodoferax sp.]